MANLLPNNAPFLKEPLFFKIDPPPANRIPMSWAKLALEGKTISHCLLIRDQPVVLLIQDPAWMAQIVKEGVDQIAKGLGYQVWCQTLLQAQRMGTLNIMNSNKFNSLMNYVLKNPPFYLNSPYLTEAKILNFVPWDPLEQPNALANPLLPQGIPYPAEVPK
ncbi:hypothetical protein FXO38_05691 [Capsicum annuum]|nr:hypothetical protein FXO38_05691 [Capsicum annuum]